MMISPKFSILRNNIKQAIIKNYNINHIITFLSNSEDTFVVDVFTDGIEIGINPETKQIIKIPKIMSFTRMEVNYKNLLKFVKLIKKMITHYEKCLLGDKK